MVTVILVSHGGMAKGMVESTTMLIGDQPDLDFITFEPGEGPDDLTAKVEKRLKEELEKGDVIIMTDIPNGTPFNCVSRLMEHYKFRHLTGMNLPMVIEFINAQLIGSAPDFIHSGRESIVSVNQLIDGMEEDEEE